MEDATMKYALPIGRLLDKITRIPGMPKLFMKIFRKMMDTSYNESAGFSLTYYERSDTALSVDITACAYLKYFTEAGCPELCKGACISDEACYGHMKNIGFKRTQTLSRGGNCCDFRFHVR